MIFSRTGIVRPFAAFFMIVPKGPTQEEGKMAITNAAEIARRAYQIWEQAGRPDGHDLEHWYQASDELIRARGAMAEDVPDHIIPNGGTSPDQRSRADT